MMLILNLVLKAISDIADRRRAKATSNLPPAVGQLVVSVDPASFPTVDGKAEDWTEGNGSYVHVLAVDRSTCRILGVYKMRPGQKVVPNNGVVMVELDYGNG